MPNILYCILNIITIACFIILLSKIKKSLLSPKIIYFKLIRIFTLIFYLLKIV